MSNFNPLLDIKEEVKQALLHHQAVVALESTIISHGMPYPQNVEMAKKPNKLFAIRVLSRPPLPSWTEKSKSV